MKTYFVAHPGYEMGIPLFESNSFKSAKAWATRNRYYLGRLRVPDIYIRLLDSREELAAVGEYNRRELEIRDTRYNPCFTDYSEFQYMKLCRGWMADNEKEV